MFSADVAFPFLCLLISGGHTMLILARDVGKYQILGSTIDDAVGEAIDKAAISLGLEYCEENGPAANFVTLAQKCESKVEALVSVKSSRLNSSLDFSFAGLKTAIDKLSKGNGTIGKDLLAKSFLESCVEQLIDKLRTVQQFLPVERIVLTGGVARNEFIYSRYNIFSHPNIDRILTYCKENNVKLWRPIPEFCTDNAAMIGWAAFERYRAGIEPKKFHDVIPSWDLGSYDH